MPDIRGVELARCGTFNLSSGPVTFTEEMLRDAADFANLEAAGSAPLGIGHHDPRFDGEPALGWVKNVHIEDRGGATLVGDLTDMPEWLHASVSRAYPNRSIDALTNFEVDGRKYAMVMYRLSLLGQTPPGITDLQSLRDHLQPTALGIAASAGTATRISVEITDPAPTPGSGDQKGVGMAYTPAQLQALGLAETATETEADAKKAELAKLLGMTEAEPEKPADQPPAPTLAPPVVEPSVQPPAVVPAPTQELVAASALLQVQKLSAEIAEMKAEKFNEKRQGVIAAAIGDGKITPAERAVWEKQYTEAPGVVETILASIKRGAAVPIGEVGHGDGAEGVNAEDDFYNYLFPDEVKAV